MFFLPNVLIVAVRLSIYSLKQSGAPEFHSQFIKVKVKDCLPVFRSGAQNHKFRIGTNRVARKVKQPPANTCRSSGWDYV